MSILMHLKYPLSYPPTEEQLQSLPTEIYEQWASDCFGTEAHIWTPSIASRYFGWTVSYRYHEIEKLKQMIFEIDE